MQQGKELKRVSADEFVKGLEVNVDTIMKISGVNTSYAIIMAKFIRDKGLYEEFLKYCEKKAKENELEQTKKGERDSQT